MFGTASVVAGMIMVIVIIATGIPDTPPELDDGDDGVGGGAGDGGSLASPQDKFSSSLAARLKDVDPDGVTEPLLGAQSTWGRPRVGTDARNRLN